MRPASFAPVILAAFAACLAEPAFAQRTMVGKWAIAGRCEAPLSVVRIGPMSLGGEDFDCDFSMISRTGDTARWAGRCNFSENGYEPAQVVAQLIGPRLRYRFVGRGWNGPFVRCPAG